MKILLSIAFLFSTTSASAQINQKTIEIRRQHTKLASYYPKQNATFVPMIFYSNAVSKNTSLASLNVVSSNAFPKPSTYSIEKAFDYYNSSKKKGPDYSGFLIMGYALLNKQQFIISNTPEETVRFFPANIKD